MNARRLTPEDVEAVKAIHDKHHDFAWQEPRLDFGTIVIEKDSQIIGAGHLRPIVEAVMILDKDASLRDKSLALKMMINQSIVDAHHLQLNEIHAWVKEPNFVAELKKHYGYEEPRGTSLVLRI